MWNCYISLKRTENTNNHTSIYFPLYYYETYGNCLQYMKVKSNKHNITYTNIQPEQELNTRPIRSVNHTYTFALMSIYVTKTFNYLSVIVEGYGTDNIYACPLEQAMAKRPSLANAV